MILKKELQEYSKLRNIKNLGHAEKDYFQNILLFLIYQKFGNEIIFKGGTALSKCYGMDRFSEDLDFACKKDFDFKFIEEGLKRFRIEFEVSVKKFERSRKHILRIKGPLFNGSRNSFCKLVLDFSFREEVFLKPAVKSIGRFLEEIPSFDVYVMDLEEIFAEKIRTIFARNKARDVYDFYFLINQRVKLNIELINKKLKYYNKKFSKKELFDSLKEKESIWNSELSGLVNNVPDFDLVMKEVRRFFLENKKGKRR
jgi:uncharacterized protein